MFTDKLITNFFVGIEAALRDRDIVIGAKIGDFAGAEPNVEFVVFIDSESDVAEPIEQGIGDSALFGLMVVQERREFEDILHDPVEGLADLAGNHGGNRRCAGSRG